MENTNQQPSQNIPSNPVVQTPPPNEEKMNNFPVIVLVSISVISVISLGAVLLLRMNSPKQLSNTNTTLVSQTLTKPASITPAPTIFTSTGNEVQDTLSTQVSDFETDFTQIDKDLSSL